MWAMPWPQDIERKNQETNEKSAMPCATVEVWEEMIVVVDLKEVMQADF